MSKHEDWSTTVIPLCPNDTTLVLCKDGNTFLEWEGGKRNRKDRIPEETAARELHEEAGVRVHKSRFKRVGGWVQYNTKTHQPYMMYLYVVELTEKEASSHFKLSREREMVGRFSWAQIEEFRRAGNVSQYHYDKLVEYGLWRTK